MDYILKSNQYTDAVDVSIKITHEESEKEFTIYVQRDGKEFQSLGIDLDQKELFSLVGTLLHIQAKMRGGQDGAR